jgi:regulator of RNase E activity RraA
MTEQISQPELGTSAISDALDMLGIDGCVPGLARRSGTGVVTGPAFTVRFEPVSPGESAPAADYLDDVPAGAVIVLANAGRIEATVWGDVLSTVAAPRGIAGTVIDGACRDVDSIRETGYSLWSAGVFMRSGKNRMAMAGAQEPVTVSGVPVSPGDLVVADGAGAVVVPAGHVAEVLRLAGTVQGAEAQILRAALTGGRLSEARKQFGYHSFALRTR